MRKTVMTMALTLALFAAEPGAIAKDHQQPDGRAVSVGVIACDTLPSMPISYFRAGSTLNPSGSQSAGAGAGQVSYTSTLEIHAPLGTAPEWRDTMDGGGHLATCTLGISGVKGTQTLSFARLIVTSVTVYGKHVDDRPLSRFYTDVKFAIVPAPTGASGWDLSRAKQG